MTRALPYKTRDAGFTLIELVVVMVVFGLLWLSLSYGMKAGLQIWDRQARAVARSDQLDTTDRALRQLVGAMIPPGPGGDPAVKGTARSLSFLTVLPSAVALSTRRADVELGLIDHRLMLNWTPHPHEVSLAESAPPSAAELLDGVEAVQFAYWHDAVGDSKAGWQDDWTEPTRPLLIRIRLKFVKGDARQWPDIIVGPTRDPEQE